jgi:predicted GNAT family acetyltransferase
MTDAAETSPEAVQVVDVPERSRFEAYVGGRLAGFANYVRDAGRIVFTHTEVDDALAGHGVGGALVEEALREVRGRGLHVVARCPFVAKWMREHPDA